MHRTYFSDIPRFFVVLILLTVFAWGCAPMQQTVKSVDMLSTPNLLMEADAAWQAKHYESTELYYAAAMERQDLVRDELPLIYERLAESAYRNEHFHQARIALEKWANQDSSALELVTWETTYLNTMAALGKTERLRNHLKWVQESTKTPWATKQAVALWYSDYFKKMDDSERALDVLNQYYQQAPEISAKAGFEQAFRQQLSERSDSEIEVMVRAVDATRQWQFPYALVTFEQGMRTAGDAETWSTSWRTMRNLTTKSALVDTVSLETELSALEARYGVPRIGLALALPLTGPYASVGVKILRGAGLAQWRLAQDGVEIDLRVINTEISGWQIRLADLPAHYSVVGGPLRVSAFKQMYDGKTPDQSVLRERAVFTFMSSLGELTEGRDAWRFFASRNDEVRSLVSMAVNELGITDLAVFYPEEKFGRTMAETFYREATPLGGRIKGMQSYPPKDLKQWSKSVGKLLKVPADFNENKDVPLEMPDFGAVFIPDGWRQAQTLLPNFFFYEGDQLVFLGPGLWSRALDTAKGIDEHYYRLAVCPGAWWEQSDGGRALQVALTEEGLGQADFWVALGYDFIRFTGRMGSLPSNWTSRDVNSRIKAAQDMDFSIARLAWDDAGVASQKLYLFSPVRNGKKLINAEKIANRISQAASRREKRMGAYEKRMQEQGYKQSQDGEWISVDEKTPDMPPEL
ncbi:hypothetical protein [uncultured Pseudodesulfovibrio sp.]|uniref:hypothetical protein n=1 Tax=uncultured Pseudodesulfovibrio sp. TaxID=2035858 RepID=UPI0029C989C2|nr:hypothetical protein [uncultured Pseudodesulfovibrio sp.]